MPHRAPRCKLRRGAESAGRRSTPRSTAEGFRIPVPGRRDARRAAPNRVECARTPAGFGGIVHFRSEGSASSCSARGSESMRRRRRAAKGAAAFYAGLPKLRCEQQPVPTTPAGGVALVRRMPRGERDHRGETTCRERASAYQGWSGRAPARVRFSSLPGVGRAADLPTMKPPPAPAPIADAPPSWFFKLGFSYALNTALEDLYAKSGRPRRRDINPGSIPGVGANIGDIATLGLGRLFRDARCVDRRIRRVSVMGEGDEQGSLRRSGSGPGIVDCPLRNRALLGRAELHSGYGALSCDAVRPAPALCRRRDCAGVLVQAKERVQYRGDSRSDGRVGVRGRRGFHARSALGLVIRRQEIVRQWRGPFRRSQSCGPWRARHSPARGNPENPFSALGLLDRDRLPLLTRVRKMSGERGRQSRAAISLASLSSHGGPASRPPDV